MKKFDEKEVVNKGGNDKESPKFKRNRRHAGSGKRDQKKEFHDKVNYSDNPMRNSIEWITKSPTFPIAARFPLSTPTGVRVKGGERLVSGQPRLTYTYANPNILVTYGVFTCGVLNDYNSPANLAIRALWLDLRSKFSGTIPVTLGQLYIYVAAVTQIVAALGWLDRLAFTMRSYKALNRIKPEYLVEVQGVNFRDLKDYQDQLWFMLSQFKTQLNALVLPKKWPVFADAYHCFHNYYKDSVDNEQAQIYFRSPITFGLFQSEDVEVNYDIDNLDWASSPVNLSTALTQNVIDSINTLFDAVLNDTTIATVSGFLSRAIDEGDRYTLDAWLDLQSESEVIYDAEDLLKLHNTRTCGIMPHIISLNPGVGNNYPYMEMDYTDVFGYYTGFTAGTVFHVDARTLDMIVTNPTSELTALASRYHTVCDYIWTHDDGTDTDITCKMVSHETFVPVIMDLFHCVSGEASPTGFLFHNASDIFSSGNRVSINADYSPVITMGPYKIGVYGTTAKSPSRILGDVYNPQPYDEDAMIRLHTSNLLSLFGITE